MADINVERKRASVWPWILGLLILALVIWGVAEMMDEDEPQYTEIESVEEEPAAVPAPGTTGTTGGTTPSQQPQGY